MNTIFFFLPFCITIYQMVGKKKKKAFETKWKVQMNTKPDMSIPTGYNLLSTFSIRPKELVSHLMMVQPPSNIVQTVTRWRMGLITLHVDCNSTNPIMLLNTDYVQSGFHLKGFFFGGGCYPWKIDNACICTHPLSEHRFKHHRNCQGRHRPESCPH